MEVTGHGRPDDFLASEDTSVLVEVRVQRLALEQATQTWLVILQELHGERLLPIWIGGPEAYAIDRHIKEAEAEAEAARPLTHDLLCSVLHGLGGSLEKVEITKVEKHIFYAELVVCRNGEMIRVDARPSDSIAIALRTSARIFANEQLLEAVSIEIAEEERPADLQFLADSLPSVEDSGGEGLAERLRRLNPEDFGRFQP